jgi:ribosomal-protein-alanine N-acetyltransferase
MGAVQGEASGLDGETIEGERICLREVGEPDVTDAYERWMNDPEVTRYLESRFSPHSKESIQDYVRRLAADRDNLLLAIVIRETGLHIGNLKLGPIDRNHRSADLGIMIGEKSSWGHGYATEAIALATEYAFEKLSLHKVTAGCYEVNEASRRAFAKAGFREEGLRKEQYLTDEGYVGGVVMGRVATASR